MVRGRWVYVRGRLGNKPRPREKMAITAACQRLIAAVLLPKYLPQITPTEFNYPVAIYGKWHGNKYRFIRGTARINPSPSPLSSKHRSPGSNIYHPTLRPSYHRHTGEWYRLYQWITLDEALAPIADGMHFQPCSFSPYGRGLQK